MSVNTERLSRFISIGLMLVAKRLQLHTVLPWGMIASGRR